jgi:hypothetical protein
MSRVLFPSGSGSRRAASSARWSGNRVHPPFARLYSRLDSPEAPRKARLERVGSIAIRVCGPPQPRLGPRRKRREQCTRQMKKTLGRFMLACLAGARAEGGREEFRSGPCARTGVTVNCTAIQSGVLWPAVFGGRYLTTGEKTNLQVLNSCPAIDFPPPFYAKPISVAV